MNLINQYKRDTQGSPLDKSIRWLFTSERTDLQARAARHFGRAMDKDLTAEQLGQFEWSIKQNMTIREYLATPWRTVFSPQEAQA